MMSKYNLKIKSLLFATIILLNTIFLQNIDATGSNSPSIGLNCSTAVLIEEDTGKILYEKQKDAPVYPASTTKIMTALLTLEHLNLNQKITVPEDMGPADGSAMYLLPGETFTVEELLQGLLIKSANDAAILLAKTISGSVEEFSNLMNQRAQEIGCQNTHFVNPNGLHDPNHTTSAYDLALISKEAMKNPKFKELVSTDFVQIHATDQTPEIRYFRNTNKFLWAEQTIDYKGTTIPIKYDVVDGIKTGYTPEAGKCLVSSGEKNGIRLIAVVMKNEGLEVYANSRKLLEYGFQNFTKKKILTANQVAGRTVFIDSLEKNLDFYVKEDYYTVENINSKTEIEQEVSLNENIKLPIHVDDEIGTLKLKENGVVLVELPIFAKNEIHSIYSLQGFIYFSKHHKVWSALIVFTFFIILIALFTIVRLISKKRRKKKRRKLSHSSYRVQ
ncbi:D-alanyl-D-alanine carboxypeptidase family protein [Filifactor alocis]|uniref:D-alanyl-D-alanine carboxypeptidase family protein n=1 Tax=Filifactor alocis TaxID=143361 RepID=UPI003FA17523